jgi:hypothetical protein
VTDRDGWQKAAALAEAWYDAYAEQADALRRGDEPTGVAVTMYVAAQRQAQADVLRAFAIALRAGETEKPR